MNQTSELIGSSSVPTTKPKKEKPKYWVLIRKGIMQHRISKRYRTYWQDKGEQVDKEFPADTPLSAIVAFRKQQIKKAGDAPAGGDGGGSFVRDIVRYLKTRKGMAGYKSDKSHLKPWGRLFGRGARYAITFQKVQTAVRDWTTEERPNGARGYKPREIRHRVRVLRELWHYFDPGMQTPCDGVKIPSPSKEKRRRPSDDLINTVAANLHRQELNGRLRDGKTRARFLVLASCGKRPCQMSRAADTDVNLERRTWDVIPVKNSDGGEMYLNNEMLAAWTLFKQANAWGPYDQASFRKTLLRNGWPKGIAPYAMRHQTSQTMHDIGVGLDIVQQELGHTSPVTTTTHYVDTHSLAASKFASEAIDGRFSKDIFVARTPQKYDQKDDKKNEGTSHRKRKTHAA